MKLVWLVCWWTDLDGRRSTNLPEFIIPGGEHALEDAWLLALHDAYNAQSVNVAGGRFRANVALDGKEREKNIIET